MIQVSDDREWRLTLSTSLTLARFVLTPFIVRAICAGMWNFACILLAVAAATDVLDGALARLLDEQTRLGACLDPLADKVLILSCFASLSYAPTPCISMPGWLFSLMALKEAVLIAGSAAVFYVRGSGAVRPAVVGKMTTAVQFACLAWILFACQYGTLTAGMVQLVVGSIALLVCASLAYYVCYGMQVCGLV